MIKKRILSVMLIFLFLFNVNISSVYAANNTYTSILKDYPQMEALLVALSVEAEVVWQDQNTMNKYFDDVFSNSGQTLSNFVSVVANNSATIPSWLISSVDSVLQGYKTTPVETVSVPNNFMSNYPVGLSASSYPYQQLINTGTNIYLLGSTNYFYIESHVSDGYSIIKSLSGTFSYQYLPNSSATAWSSVIASTGMCLGGFTTSWVTWSLGNLYSNSSCSTVSVGSSSATTSVPMDFTQDIASAPSVPQTTAQAGDLYSIPATINPSTMVGVTASNLSQTGITTATSTSISHDDATSILDSTNSINDTLKHQTDVPANDTPTLNFSPLQLSLSDKFPFCVPFDLAKSISSFTATSQAPVFTFQMPQTTWGNNVLVGGSFKIDMGDSKLTPLVLALRYFILLVFVVCLIKLTRSVIRG